MRPNPLIAFIKSLVFHGLEFFGKYYSCYRGFVADVDDPENLQRLKLIIPQISGNSAYNYWAFPKGVFSGPGYGSQCLPKQGDVVWVEFEGGCPEVPIWSHGHFAKKEIPTDDKDLKKTDCYWFKTPGGNWVKLYDTKKLIHIQNSSGHYLKLDENTIHSEEVKGNAWELNPQGFSVISKKGISLGTLDGSEFHAVLGEKDKDVLKDINTILKTLHEAMVRDLPVYTSKGFTNMVTAIPEVIPQVEGLEAKIELILSDLVTLDK
jgi:hypothetical protein